MKYFRNHKWLLAVLLVVVIVLVVALVLANKPTKTVTITSKAPTVAVVEITSTGFVPQTLGVAPNTTVVWVNEDVMPHLPAADPYPTHAELPSLVAPKALGQKETFSYTFTKPGTIHYHDDLNPTLTGEVEVR